MSIEARALAARTDAFVVELRGCSRSKVHSREREMCGKSSLNNRRRRIVRQHQACLSRRVSREELTGTNDVDGVRHIREVVDEHRPPVSILGQLLSPACDVRRKKLLPLLHAGWASAATLFSIDGLGANRTPRTRFGTVNSIAWT